GPRELVALASRAEDAGFGFALVSDHYHPWTSAQGNAPFVWTVIGGIAEATERLRIGTGVYEREGLPRGKERGPGARKPARRAGSPRRGGTSRRRASS